jgi:ribosomal protein S7
MKVFKNGAGDCGLGQMVYMRAESNPNPKYYYECLEDEVKYALRQGKVAIGRKNEYHRIAY